MPTVVVTPSHFQHAEQPYYKILSDAGINVRFSDSSLPLHDPQVLVTQLADAEAVLASTEPYHDEVFKNSNLRIVSRAGVGYDSVNLKDATSNNVAVTITPGTVHESVAEQALAFIFAIYRNVLHRDKLVRDGHWNRKSFPRISGKILGLIGLGTIGRCLANKATALGLKVIAADPQLSPESAEKQGVSLVSLEELLATSDIVSLHAPSIPATYHMINQGTLEQMKDGALFINTARGPLVDEQALYKVLVSGKLIGAGIDVFEEEPPAKDNPLLSLENVVVAPHMAGLDQQSEIDMASTAAQNIVDLFQGKYPHDHIVNRDLPADWKW